MHDTPENTLLLQTIGKFVSDQVTRGDHAANCADRGARNWRHQISRRSPARDCATSAARWSRTTAQYSSPSPTRRRVEVPGQSPSWQLAVKAGRDAPAPLAYGTEATR